MLQLNILFHDIELVFLDLQLCLWAALCVSQFSEAWVHQGWDSSTFTRISMEQKLKSVVDDDHFHGEKIDQKNKIKSKAVRVRTWLVHILSCSQVIPGCARTLHYCSGFQK